MPIFWISTSFVALSLPALRPTPLINGCRRISEKALVTWGLYELDKRRQTAIIILVGAILPVAPLVLTLAMVLPIFQLSSVLRCGS